MTDVLERSFDEVRRDTFAFGRRNHPSVDKDDESRLEAIAALREQRSADQSVVAQPTPVASRLDLGSFRHRRHCGVA